MSNESTLQLFAIIIALGFVGVCCLLLGCLFMLSDIREEIMSQNDDDNEREK